MTETELQGVLSFLRSAEQLKNTLRSGRTSNGRHESTAEHTWRLCLMVMLFEAEYPDLDFLKLIKICIVHDLGETLNGDIPAVDQRDDIDKSAQERADIELLVEPLPDRLQKEILELWEEYESAATPEARLAKAFDKMETVLQHTQGKNPPDFDYVFNLSYGKYLANFDPLTSTLRTLIDRDTQARADERKG